MHMHLFSRANIQRDLVSEKLKFQIVQRFLIPAHSQLHLIKTYNTALPGLYTAFFRKSENTDTWLSSCRFNAGETV